MLTVFDFNELTFNEKAEAVWKGSYLADREEEGRTVQLYSLGAFYVELFYDPSANEIAGFHAFTSRNLLVPYLAQNKYI